MSDPGRTLGVIPARGGSKRIPGKNLADVGGKPLVAHAVEHSEEADHVDRALVSTDDPEIAAVAREYGGEAPFERPAELATDTATSAAVVTHALDWATEADGTYDCVALLQPTSPLRSPTDVDGALAALAGAAAESVVSVSEYLTPPQWAVTADADGHLSTYFETGSLWEADAERSQDIPALAHPNGAVFAATVEAWREHGTFYTPATLGYEMPPERSFDIDEPWELDLVRELV